MRYPVTTGAVARLLNTTEPRVAETVRRGRVAPPPEIVAGRRAWTHEQVVQAAQALGIKLPAAFRDQAAATEEAVGKEGQVT